MNKSKFDFLIEKENKLKNKGYDYQNKGIFINFLSSYIYYNKKLQPLILKLEEFVQFSIYNTKYIKKLINFTIRNTDDNIN